MSSFLRGHANLPYIVPILVYVLANKQYKRYLLFKKKFIKKFVFCILNMRPRGLNALNFPFRPSHILSGNLQALKSPPHCQSHDNFLTPTWNTHQITTCTCCVTNKQTNKQKDTAVLTYQSSEHMLEEEMPSGVQ